VKPINPVKQMASGKSAKKGGRQRWANTSLDLPPDLYEQYKSDPDETYGERKSRVQWIRRYWAEQWFYYHFVTPEYAEKNAVRPSWADIVYRKLIPKTKADAIAQSFYPCMCNIPSITLHWSTSDNAKSPWLTELDHHLDHSSFQISIQIENSNLK
jgi:hypothetical protein